MAFTDKARIIVSSGRGGNGHISFRREKFVPAGGPDGGDGGNGGDVIFAVDEGLNTLEDFRHALKFSAENGEDGGKKKCSGKCGADLTLKVPEGTVIKDFATGKVIADMSGDCKEYLLLKGGHVEMAISITQRQRCRHRNTLSQDSLRELLNCSLNLRSLLMSVL